METTIDQAGRIVIPKDLRDRIGLRPGRVDITVDGVAIRIEPVSDEGLVEQDGRLVIPAAGAEIDDALVQALREADQR